jgi:F-type H+-transporting ATPase subunit h
LSSPSSAFDIAHPLGPEAQLTNPLLADLVQDLYIKELKAYKAPAVKADDAQGQVSTFSPPSAPKSPEEADIANELKQYEASTVDIEGQAEGGAAEPEEHWFEEEPEEEAAHH